MSSVNPLTSSAATVAHSLTGVRPAAASTGAAATSSTSSSSGGSSSMITSGDFLTLLVTEMKNQDPTQPTDPNAYIQQLVGVNSLQELISINQELGTATGSSANGGMVSNGASANAISQMSAT